MDEAVEAEVVDYEEVTAILNSAIDYALVRPDDGLAWLLAWREGDAAATRELIDWISK